MVKIICFGCKKEVEKKRNQKYCSNECCLKYRNYIISEETKIKLRNACIKNGNRPPSNLGKPMSEEQKIKLREIHLKLWDIKGRKIYKRPKHSGSENNLWRKKIFERDNYTCQECGVKSSNGIKVTLNAHHIKSFIEYPELRLELSNGITLCINCHKLTDNYGWKLYNMSCGSWGNAPLDKKV